MKVQSVVLTANQKHTLGGGNFFMLVETTAALNVKLLRGSALIEEAESVQAGYKAQRPEWYGASARYFDAVEILSTTGQTIKVGVSDGIGGYDRSVGSVDATIVGTVDTNVIAGSTIAAEAARVSVGLTAVQLIAAGTGRKSVRFYNAGTADVWLGSSTITTANGAVKIAPGQTWVEDGAPNAEWFGISGTVGQSVGVQAVS